MQGWLLKIKNKKSKLQEGISRVLKFSSQYQDKNELITRKNIKNEDTRMEI